MWHQGDVSHSPEPMRLSGSAKPGGDFLCDLSKQQRKKPRDNQEFKEQGGNYLGNEMKTETVAKGLG